MTRQAVSKTQKQTSGSAKSDANGPEIHCCCDAVVPLAEIRPNPRNPNTHPERQVALLAKLIRDHGWRLPISVSRRSGMIVRGHGRLAAARLLGLDCAPVDYQDYPSDEAELADLIADNAVAELAELDMPAVKDLILELDTGALDLELTGYDMRALEEMMLAMPPIDPPEPAEPTQSHADAIPVRVDVPVRVALVSKTEIIEALTKAAAPFGCSVLWP